jgi:hypothetical protein
MKASLSNSGCSGKESENGSRLSLFVIALIFAVRLTPSLGVNYFVDFRSRCIHFNVSQPNLCIYTSPAIRIKI